MPSSTPNLSGPDALRATWERRLLARARMGSRPAINTLADWYSAWLRRWARGRLPRWSRGAVDTSDVVQDGLQRLSPRDRRLIVGRVELGYNYRQLAFIERIPSADAARKAVRRALVRLSGEMPQA